MKNRQPELYLTDILESINQIEQYITGFTLGSFEEDLEKQDSVMRRLEIIGEAAKQMPEDFKAVHPEVPWRDIADFRNVLIHEYSGIKRERVWKVTQKDLPVLKAHIISFLRK